MPEPDRERTGDHFLSAHSQWRRQLAEKLVTLDMELRDFRASASR